MKQLNIIQNAYASVTEDNQYSTMGGKTLG